MNYTDTTNTDTRRVIIVDEGCDIEIETTSPALADDEGGVITIEHDDEPTAALKRCRWWLWAVAAVGTVVVVLALSVAGYHYWRRNYYTGVEVSCTSQESIAKLQQPLIRERAEVIVRTDTIRGVPFRYYELRGLRAEISMKEPSAGDKDVYLYCRSSDFSSYDPKKNHYIGSLVVDGQLLSSDNTRLGYCAMAGDAVVIGIGRDEEVRDYCVEQGGCFFRQFILVSAGQLPPRYYLHGKVERRALGRMGDRLYFIESQDKEGLRSFAEALQDYGFEDAIYITGGADYCYYRTADGVHHDIGSRDNKVEKAKGRGIIPWLVFRKIRNQK